MSDIQTQLRIDYFFGRWVKQETARILLRQIDEVRRKQLFAFSLPPMLVKESLGQFPDSIGVNPKKLVATLNLCSTVWMKYSALTGS